MCSFTDLQFLPSLLLIDFRLANVRQKLLEDKSNLANLNSQVLTAKMLYYFIKFPLVTRNQEKDLLKINLLRIVLFNWEY